MPHEALHSTVHREALQVQHLPDVIDDPTPCLGVLLLQGPAHRLDARNRCNQALQPAELGLEAVEVRERILHVEAERTPKIGLSTNILTWVFLDVF